MNQKNLKGKAFFTPLFQGLSVSSASLVSSSGHTCTRTSPGSGTGYCFPGIHCTQTPGTGRCSCHKSILASELDSSPPSWAVCKTSAVDPSSGWNKILKVIPKYFYQDVLYLGCRLFWKRSCLMSFIDLFQVATCCIFLSII